MSVNILDIILKSDEISLQKGIVESMMVQSFVFFDFVLFVLLYLFLGFVRFLVAVFNLHIL